MIFLHADNVSASYWKKRNDFLKLPPHLEDCDIDALEKSISDYFSALVKFKFVESIIGGAAAI